MTDHPSSDHPCDHCYLCDVVGICCATISVEQCIQIEGHIRHEFDCLRQATITKASSTPTLADRLRGDTQRSPSSCLLMEAASPLRRPTDLPNPNQRKEPIHVVAACTPR